MLTANEDFNSNDVNPVLKESMYYAGLKNKVYSSSRATFGVFCDQYFYDSQPAKQACNVNDLYIHIPQKNIISRDEVDEKKTNYQN